MYPEITASPEALKEHLLAFMDDYIYPNEQRYHDQLSYQEDRKSVV